MKSYEQQLFLHITLSDAAFEGLVVQGMRHSRGMFVKARMIRTFDSLTEIARRACLQNISNEDHKLKEVLGVSLEK